MGKVIGSLFYSEKDNLMDVHYGDVEATIKHVGIGEASLEADGVDLNQDGTLTVCVNIVGTSGDQFKHYVTYEDEETFPYPYFRYVPYNMCEDLELESND